MDCIKIAPEVVKFHIFEEIVQGLPPAVSGFPENRSAIGDWKLSKTKIKSWVTELRIPFHTASVVPILLGKRRLVVRLGRSRAASVYGLPMTCAHPVLLVGVVTGIMPLVALLGFITLARALTAIQHAGRHFGSSFDLVPANALTAASHLATALLLALAYVWRDSDSQAWGTLLLLVRCLLPS